MQIYLVGGAVRDELLGLPIKERDWVVIGSSPQEMQALGYQAVGKDFPVFLHPQTNEEYALARTERKVAKGYKGFTFHADPDVTLDADLQRRDLTINAMAKDEQGQLIDPYHGQDDLKAKRLRHVSAAFAEDPVRILRVARFAAKLPDFTVDPDTNKLMQQMVTNGEVDALVAERVWQELSRALTEAAPQRFFDVLKNCGALKILFPPLQNNIAHINEPQLTVWQRFALLVNQLDIESIKALCARYKIPTDFRDLALATVQLSELYLQLDTKNAKHILDFLKRSDALRREQRFHSIVELLALIHTTNHLSLLNLALTAIKNIDTSALQAQQLKGEDFANALEALQLAAITQMIK